jgi:hypothetical protein
MIFLATEGSISQLTKDGQWIRRYAHSMEDGLANVPVLSLAGRTPGKLLAEVKRSGIAADSSYYQYDRVQDQWTALPATEETREQFAQQRSLLFEDNAFWTGVYLPSYWQVKGQTGSATACRLSLAWKGEPVFLTDTPSGIRFAHDLRLSVETHSGFLWFATAGGVVRQQLASLSSSAAKSPPEITLYAKDFAGSGDLWNPPPPPVVGLVKRTKGSSSLSVLLLQGSPDQLEQSKYDLSRVFQYQSDTETFVVDPQADAQSVCKVVDDGFWYWSKEKPLTLLVEFYPGIADLPPGYRRIANGTFRFFDPIAGVATGGPFRSIISLDDQLHVATEGGILTFEAASQRPKRLVAAIDASRRAGLWTIESVKGFFLQPRTRELFAFVELLDSAKATRKAVLRLEKDSRAPRSTGQWSLYTGPDPFAGADVLVDNDLLVWRQKSTGAEIQLKNSDLEPGSPYELFYQGKFSFDQVFAAAPLRDTVWLATAGGAVEVQATDRQIRRVFAKCFGLDRTRRLPDLREIVAVPRPDSTAIEVFARTREKANFRFVPPRNPVGLGSWQAVPAEEANWAFDTAYRKKAIAPEFWTWVQPPEGVYVRLHPTTPADLEFGSLAPQPHFPLMSRGRFAWDDLRAAAICGKTLLFATPAGVCVYELAPSLEQPTFRTLFGQAQAPSGQHIPMTQLERLVDEGDQIAAWNREHVFVGTYVGGSWQWRLDTERSPEYMERSRRVVNPWGIWQIERGKQGRGLTVRCQHHSLSPATVFHAAWVRADSYDIPSATVTPEGILIPGKKGVLQIDLDFAQRQRRFQIWAVVLTAAAFMVGLALFWPARSLRSKSAEAGSATPNSSTDGRLAQTAPFEE